MRNGLKFTFFQKPEDDECLVFHPPKTLHISQACILLPTRLYGTIQLIGTFEAVISGGERTDGAPTSLLASKTREDRSCYPHSSPAVDMSVFASPCVLSPFALHPFPPLTQNPLKCPIE
jgi:hypothetical protein